MQFCKKCGGALNLFETNEEGICWTCVRKSEKKVVSAPAGKDESSELSESALTLEGDMLVLKSIEGWVLWSGPAAKAVKLGDILKRARRIHQIRSKRLQHKS